MSESDKEALYEQHAARLHALLRDERVAQAGLPTDDIVRALGLPEADVNAIMVVAESREIVELDLSSSQALWTRVAHAHRAPAAFRRGQRAAATKCVVRFRRQWH